MPIKNFPPVEEADEDGLLAIGGDLSVESLLLAYRNGIFVWPIQKDILTWFAPPKRAILFFDEFHVSKSLQKVIDKQELEFKINTNFRAVIEACARTERPGQRGTWITKEVLDGYTALHEAGHCYSFETYKDEQLVGGVYGVLIDKMFAAESMFYTESNASKIALYYLVQYLKEQGFTWIDCQVLNEFSQSFGAREVSRTQFMKMLKETID